MGGYLPGLVGDLCQDVHLCMAILMYILYNLDDLDGVGWIRECKEMLRIGQAHLLLQWPNLLWSHVWIGHM